jgi:cyclohexyl-isocyanide hydratase
MPTLSPLSIAFLLFPNVTQLDLTGPAQILSRLGKTKLDLVWHNLDPVMTDAGFAIVPTATFAEVAKADILCVPGGFGTTDVIKDDAAMTWVRAIGADADWVTSVCTGSLILGAAGLLKGYKATTHWAWKEYLPLFGAEPVEARHVIDRNRATGGGVTAGIDFALALTAAIRGEEHAKNIQLGLEYDPAPPFDAGSPAKAGKAMVDAYTARSNALAPNRTADFEAAAKHLGFFD